MSEKKQSVLLTAMWRLMRPPILWKKSEAEGRKGEGA